MRPGARALVVGAALSTVAAGLGATPARAQEPRAHRTVRLAIDNDILAPRGRGVPPDYDYTQGARVGLDRDVAPRWASRLTGAHECRAVADPSTDCLTSSLTVSQEIYTPRRDAPTPVVGERPYAGWLAGAAALRLSGARRTHSVSVSLGVTGPLSGAEQVQNAVHQMLHNTAQEGWAHQLPTEPTVQAQYEGARLFTSGRRGCGVARAAAYGGASLGTVQTGAQIGARGWLGCAGNSAWTPVDPLELPPLRLYIVGGYSENWVGRDMFVDGSFFRESVHAERRPWVGVAELGVGARLRHLSVEYRASRTGRQYGAEPGPHTVGTVAIAIH